MKRFLEDLKTEDLLFYDPSSTNVDEAIPELPLPVPIKEMDASRINIIVDPKINNSLGKTCKEIVDALLHEKTFAGAVKFQESTAKFFIETFRKNREKVEVISIIALHYLMLCREHLYRLNIEVQKTQSKLNPIQRKGLRFHAGYNCAQIFKSIFSYKIPYFVKDYDFNQFAHLFNPIFLSGSFPEYFLSDYFCYLGIKKPFWTFERFTAYKEMLWNSSKSGLSSFIGVSLTSKGAALQVIYRIIRGKHKTFNEETVGEIIKVVQDDPEILSEILKDRVVRKSILTGELPKNLSKNELTEIVQTEFQLASSRIPLSEFFSMALEAEILRKIMNNIVLIDPMEYPQGYGELLPEYSLYIVRPPYIYKEKESRTSEVSPQTEKPKIVAPDEVIEKDETVRIHFDYDALMNEIKNRNADSALDNDTKTDPAHLEENDQPLDDESLIKQQAKLVEEVLDDVVDEISQTDREYLTMPELSEEEIARIAEQENTDDRPTDALDGNEMQQEDEQDSVDTTTDDQQKKGPTSTEKTIEQILASMKKPYLYGLFDIAEGRDLFLRERQVENGFFLLEEVPQKQANFKIIIGDAEGRFLINKKSDWQKPTALRLVKDGILAAALRAKSDNARYYLYLIDADQIRVDDSEADELKSPEESPLVASNVEEAEAAEDAISPLQDLYDQNSVEVPEPTAPPAPVGKDLSEFKEMSVAELSQALLDGLLDIDDYNSLLANGKEDGDLPSPIMEEPDVVLNEGMNYCSDWQGRILSGSEDESDLRIIIKQSSFQIEVKIDDAWKVLVPRNEIVPTGTQGEFQKDIVFNDPTVLDSEKSARIIAKEYSYQIFPLMGGNFGIKFY